MQRIKMEVYLDIDGTNKEVNEEVNDFINRTHVEFAHLDILVGDPLTRPIRENQGEEIQPYEALELEEEE